MKSPPNKINRRWPTRKLCIGNPTQPIFHLLALGVMQILAFTFGVMQILVFLDTDMLALGVLPNATAQPECFCIAVEYRLNTFLGHAL